ncbi:hypothetical protein [Ectobacillus polymachus]|uniref:hypothetical protein n=1 Tax=Ectobacillus polymachus TaxID=1508806 RepID=UPI003A8931DC
MNQDQMVQKINDLSDMIQQNNSNMQFDITTLLTILGILIAVSAIGGPLLIKFWVNYTVNSELDKRLLKLLEANPPIFSFSSSAIPDEKNRIYLREDIPGVDQIDPVTVLSVSVSAEHPSIQTIIQPIQDSGLIGYLYLDDEDKRPYLSIPNYFSSNGKVNYSILWPRSKFVKKG